MSTETITAAHILVATLDCQGDPDDDSHHHDPECLDYTIECPGVTDKSGCREFGRCTVCTPADIATMTAAWNANELGWKQEAHGVTHSYADELGLWLAPSGNCWAIGHDELNETAAELKVNGPGRYSVDVECEGDNELVLVLNDDAESAE
jgi:hypothetical protein